MEKVLRNEKTAILVLGMHRSGTSCLSRCLNILGYAAPDTLIGINKSNISGHWESEKIARLNDDILAEMGLTWDKWSIVDINRIKSKTLTAYTSDIQSTIKAEFKSKSNIFLKEPRICLVAEFYFQALKKLSFDSHVLVQFRNPLDVIESLNVRNKLSKPDAALLWLRYNLNAEFASRGRPRNFINFNDVLESPVKVFKGISKSLAFDFPEPLKNVSSQIKKFVRPSKTHSSHTNEQVIHDEITKGWISDAYSSLLILNEDPNSLGALNVLDRVRAEFNSACPEMARIFGHIRVQQTTMNAQYVSELENIQTTKRELETSLKAEEQNIAEIKAQYGEKISKIETARDEALSSLKKEKQNIAEIKAQYGEKISKIETARDEALSSLKKEKQNIAEIKAQYGEKISSLKADLLNFKQQTQKNENKATEHLALFENAQKAIDVLTVTQQTVSTEYRETLKSLRQTKKDNELTIATQKMQLDQSIGERGQLEKTLQTHGKNYEQLKTKLKGLEGSTKDREVEFKDLSVQKINLEKKLDKASDENRKLEEQIEENVEATKKQIRKKIREIEERDSRLKELRRINRNLQKEKWKLQDQVSISNDWLNEYRNSTSWKITAPIRSSKELLRNIKSAFTSAPQAKHISSQEQVEPKESTKVENYKTTIKQPASRKSDSDIIKASGLFDAVYYQAQYPEVQVSDLLPLEHYMTEGWKRGFQPSAQFNTQAYLVSHPALKNGNKCPLLHFVQNELETIQNSAKTNNHDLGKIVVFTAIAGSYDDLKHPLIVSNNVDYVVFSDGAVPENEVWQHRPFDYYFAESTRMARYIKTHPHIYFDDYDWAIWVDANLQLNCMPEDLIREHYATHELVTWHHPLRNCVYNEAKECVKRDKDKSELISEQMKKYKSLNYPKDNGLFETSVMISKPGNQNVINLMNKWWHEILTGSRRDQLGLPFALEKDPIKVGYLAPEKICMRSDPRFIYYRHL